MEEPGRSAGSPASSLDPSPWPLAGTDGGSASETVARARPSNCAPWSTREGPLCSWAPLLNAEVGSWAEAEAEAEVEAVPGVKAAPRVKEETAGAAEVQVEANGEVQTEAKKEAAAQAEVGAEVGAGVGAAGSGHSNSDEPEATAGTATEVGPV